LRSFTFFFGSVFSVYIYLGVKGLDDVDIYLSYSGFVFNPPNNLFKSENLLLFYSYFPSFPSISFSTLSAAIDALPRLKNGAAFIGRLTG